MTVGDVNRFKRFFWPSVENDDYLSTASHRALILFSIAGFIISIFITMRYIVVQPVELSRITETVLFSFPIFLLFPYMLYRNISITTVGRAFAIYTVIRLTVLAVSFGGIDSTQSLFLLPVVLIATFVLGSKEGFIGLFATFFVYVWLFVSQKTQLSSAEELNALTQHFVQLSAVLLMIVSAGATFRHQLVKAVEDLAEAKANSDASNLAKSEFLANMSHEIRTPMNGVLGMADVLKNTSLTPKQEMLVQTIDKSGNALLKIINDILDFSKIEADKMEFESEHVDIREIVADVSALLRTAASDKGIELRAKCADDVPGVVCGDGGRIRQILVNLVGNAIKFTETGFVLVEVSATIEDNLTTVEFSVSDTGIGIAAEKIADVFDKFSQGDGSMTRRYGGTGLGLAISHSLVTAMNGEIGLTSELGKGSKFYFHLTMPVIEKQAKPFEPSLHNETKVPVLVIAGNADNGRRIIKSLASWGVRSVSAKTGQKALTALSKIAETKFQFPLIILDDQLSDIRSFQIIEQINTSDNGGVSPVIFVRSDNASEIEERFLVAKADRSIGPIFSDQELKQATYDLLMGVPGQTSEIAPNCEKDAFEHIKVKSSAA